MNDKSLDECHAIAMATHKKISNQVNELKHIIDTIDDYNKNQLLKDVIDVRNKLDYVVKQHSPKNPVFNYWHAIDLRFNWLFSYFKPGVGVRWRVSEERPKWDDNASQSGCQWVVEQGKWIELNGYPFDWFPWRVESYYSLMEREVDEEKM